MTVHISFYSDMLDLQQRDTELLLFIKFRFRKENMCRHTSIFLTTRVSVCGDVVNNTPEIECLVSATRLAKSVTHLRPCNVRSLNCGT
jgi:hypothetical protein